MGNTPVDPKRHLPASSTDNSSLPTETMQKKEESNNNTNDNDKIRTSSKRNRRPPEKFVARPSRQGVGCYEGDLAFLNDDYLSPLTTNRNRKKKKINRDNGSNGNSDKNESSKNSNDGKEASNIAKKRKSTTENILEGPSKKKRVIESNITSDVNNGISVRTSARSRRYVFIIIN